MIALGGFLVFIGALGHLLYGDQEDDDGSVGWGAGMQIALADGALMVGLALLAVGMVISISP